MRPADSHEIRNPERKACSEVTLERDRWSSCSINCRGEDVTHQSRHGRRGIWGREPGKASGAWVEEGLMELLCCAGRSARNLCCAAVLPKPLGRRLLNTGRGVGWGGWIAEHQPLPLTEGEAGSQDRQCV